MLEIENIIYLAKKSYYVVAEEQIQEFEQLNKKIKHSPLYVDLCASVLRPECQLFFDFYIYLTNEDCYVNYERTLNIPLYAYLNEVVSKHPLVKQLKQQQRLNKEMHLVMSMQLNKTLQYVLRDILVEMNIPLPQVIEAITRLEEMPQHEQSAEFIYLQAEVMRALKARFQNEAYLSTCINAAISDAKAFQYL